MGTLKIVINHLVIYFIYEFLLRSLYVLLICLVLSEMLAAEEMNSNREMLNPLNPAGKQQLADIVTRHQEFNVLQTTEQAGDVLDLLEKQFFEVLQSCDDHHLGILKTFLEGKLVLEHGERRDVNAVNARNILSYYDKLSKIEDQRKCLEICASLLNDVEISPYAAEHGAELIKLPPENRPVTTRVRTPLSTGRSHSAASRSTDTILRRDHSALLNAYETTYDRQFSRPMTAVNIVRPRSAYPSGADELSELRKHYSSTYSTQFYEKEPTRSAPIRSGSGSGNRRNNPHPLKSFMVYQLPRSQPLGLRIPQEPTFGDRTVQSAIQGKTVTTYDHNYLCSSFYKPAITRKLETRQLYSSRMQHELGQSSAGNCTKRESANALQPRERSHHDLRLRVHT